MRVAGWAESASYGRYRRRRTSVAPIPSQTSATPSSPRALRSAYGACRGSPGETLLRSSARAGDWPRCRGGRRLDERAGQRWWNRLGTTRPSPHAAATPADGVATRGRRLAQSDLARRRPWAPGHRGCHRRALVWLQWRGRRGEGEVRRDDDERLGADRGRSDGASVPAAAIGGDGTVCAWARRRGNVGRGGREPGRRRLGRHRPLTADTQRTPVVRRRPVTSRRQPPYDGTTASSSRRARPPGRSRRAAGSTRDGPTDAWSDAGRRWTFGDGDARSASRNLDGRAPHDARQRTDTAGNTPPRPVVSRRHDDVTARSSAGGSKPRHRHVIVRGTAPSPPPTLERRKGKVRQFHFAVNAG